MAQVSTPFGVRMRELAVSGHERGDDLLAMADEFDDAVSDPDFDARQLVKVWARCHRLWKECTGEDPFSGMTAKAAKLAAHLVLVRMNPRRE